MIFFPGTYAQRINGLREKKARTIAGMENLISRQFQQRNRQLVGKKIRSVANFVRQNSWPLMIAVAAERRHIVVRKRRTKRPFS